MRWRRTLPSADECVTSQSPRKVCPPPSGSNYRADGSVTFGCLPFYGDPFPIKNVISICLRDQLSQKAASRCSISWRDQRPHQNVGIEQQTQPPALEGVDNMI